MIIKAARYQQTAYTLCGLALLAACAKKAEPAAPPVPPQQPQAQTTTSPQASPPVDTGAISASTITPGSLQDLIAAAGSDRVFFAYDSADLDSGSQEILRKEAAWMQKNSSVKITIEGHSDERGTREYNLALGDRRAEAVKRYMVSLNVAPSRIATISYGKERPEAVGSDEESWAKNRRGVTVINGGPVG